MKTPKQLIFEIIQQPELKDIWPEDYAELMGIDIEEYQTPFYNGWKDVSPEFVEKMAEAVYYKIEWKNESKELGMLVKEKNDLDDLTVEELKVANKKLKDIINTLLNEQ